MAIGLGSQEIVVAKRFRRNKLLFTDPTHRISPESNLILAIEKHLKINQKNRQNRSSLTK
jgi:hypothetical protein